MRERLECALWARGQEAWIAELSGTHLGGRLVLQALPGTQGSPLQLLDDPAMQCGRYDAALVYVDAQSLCLWRTALAARARRLPAVLLVYAVGLRSQAIRDLMRLGVSDFMRPPFCLEELRARVDHALYRLAPMGVAENGPQYGASVMDPEAAPGASQGGMPAGAAAAEPCDAVSQRSASELEAYAVALAMQRAASKDSFRAAKGRVVARFERAYIRAALGRHGGNITQAARMAQKHRRAFWALMRKHDIDPAPYRDDSSLMPSRSTQAG